jgi:hypothetical protein
MLIFSPCEFNSSSKRMLARIIIVTSSFYSPGVGVVSGSHLTPASSAWMQLCDPMGLAGQEARRASVPAQLTLSR